MPSTPFAAVADGAVLSVGPWALLLLALPIILLGEAITARLGWLRRANIPAAVVGGLLVALILLGLHETRPGTVELNGNTTHGLWLWATTPTWGIADARPTDVERPLLILFFTCVGLNASWAVARRGGWPLVILLGLSIGVAAFQAAVGAATAAALGESPLLGVMSGNVALMGGFGTAAGFAPEFEKAGLTGAATLGVAAAAFGVVAGGILAGWIGGLLVAKARRTAPTSTGSAPTVSAEDTGTRFLAEVHALWVHARATLIHLAVLIGCMKLGAFLSVYVQGLGLTFPVYMGSMVVAAVVRNAHDLGRGAWLSTDRTDAIGAVALAWLLAVVMVDLQLARILYAAGPLLVVLVVQVALLALLAYTLIFRWMGRDYEAAVISAGMIGFGLGAMSNAMASMRVLAARYGAAPKAFLIVPIVGAFLVDFANALITTTALNLFK